MAGVINRYLKARRGKMLIENKLAVLQTIKQEEGVLFGSFLNDTTKQKKCEKWKCPRLLSQ
jgi:hypothetical protein